MEKKYHIDYSFTDNPVSYKDTILLQLGRLYCMPSYCVEKHAHLDWYELTVVTDGEGVISTNDVPINVKKGDIYLSYPGDFHEIISSGKHPLKYDFFAFNTKNKKLKKELKRIVESVCQYEKRVFRDEQINETVANAIAELSAKQEYHTEILCSLFEQIVLYVVRNLSVDKPAEKKKHTVSADELCFQIMHYIDTHIYSIENLSELSGRFNYNYSYLSDLFKKNTGSTIADYYHTRRLDAARMLINERKLRITQIAEMLNYSSLYAFSKAFKNKFGVSPREYLRELDCVG